MLTKIVRQLQKFPIILRKIWNLTEKNLFLSQKTLFLGLKNPVFGFKNSEKVRKKFGNRVFPMFGIFYEKMMLN